MYMIKKCVDNHCLDVCHISIVDHTQNAVTMTGTNIIYILRKYCIIFIPKEIYRGWNWTQTKTQIMLETLHLVAP